MTKNCKKKTFINSRKFNFFEPKLSHNLLDNEK